MSVVCCSGSFTFDVSELVGAAAADFSSPPPPVATTTATTTATMAATPSRTPPTSCSRFLRAADAAVACSRAMRSWRRRSFSSCRLLTEREG